MIFIEFCQSNMALWTKSVFEQLGHDPEWSDAEVMESECLGNCEQCFAQPFAIVEGEVVAADTPDALLTEIRAFIKKKEELDRQWRELGF
ncbi:hypothetical protein BEP19_13895 [Ammoniphilus oxalaticus]|uniref:UDP-N-acetylmuramoylalanine--D-glutamate ligase n=1 Tax=Ammoniphilus oxalaticus TaxID=66863 RepID=A0A419SEH4_9BACL|nr:DUF1450 domain-containing protein [Ammoniphilus oxalaticus]RKD21718.1 hypothetical protein BEP19_13895 [Ammoniphilus oxalaticus]